MKRTTLPIGPLRHACTAVVMFLALCGSVAIASQNPRPLSAQPEAALNPDEILHQMSRITGLPVKAPLKNQRVGKPEVEKYLKDNLAAEYTPAEIHGQEAALKAFGLVGADFDLQKFLVSLYTEQAAGFYDPRRRTMFIADWVEPDQQKMVLAHELTHALQDQSFDLWKFMHATPDNDDSSAARQALVEGYATLAMIQVMLGSVPIEKLPSLDAMMEQVVNQQMTEYPVFSKAPFFLRFQVLFPYAQGIHFVREGLVAGGWKRLNEAFDHPPSSTAEIFQPDRYFKLKDSGDQQDPVLDLPSPPAVEHDANLKQVEANTMGKLGYYALLAQLLSQDQAAKATKSWAADRYLVYEGPEGGQYMLIARTRWRTSDAARTFCTEYRSILEKRWPEAGGRSDHGTSATPADETQGELLYATSGPRRAFLQLQGNECRWAEGLPAAEADGVAKWLDDLR